jgi:predicted RNA-binding Zn-ribbon protein involved in translation (DUF1610 family)
MATLWEARKAGWIVALKCDRRREGLKSVKPCAGTFRLHLSTLISTIGPDVKLEELQRRVRCPGCGTDRFALQLTRPPEPSAGAKDAEQPRRKMRQAGSGETTLGTSREPWVVFMCDKCGRRGESRRTHLIEEFGNMVSFPDLLAIFAHSRGCGLAVPHPEQHDLTRAKECLIRYDVER